MTFRALVLHEDCSGPSAVISVFFPANCGEIVELHLFVLILHSNVIAFFFIIIKGAVLELNRQNDRHWPSTTDVSFQVFCNRTCNTKLTRFPSAYNIICNSRCAYYFSEVLKLYRLCNKNRMRK